jgi:acyl carrier protein
MDEIGVEDNFFDIGANSLLLIRIVSAINHEFNKDLKVVALFDCPNVQTLAATHFSNELDAVSIQ